LAAGNSVSSNRDLRLVLDPVLSLLSLSSLSSTAPESSFVSCGAGLAGEEAVDAFDCWLWVALLPASFCEHENSDLSYLRKVE